MQPCMQGVLWVLAAVPFHLLHGITRASQLLWVPLPTHCTFVSSVHDMTRITSKTRFSLKRTHLELWHRLEGRVSPHSIMHCGCYVLVPPQSIQRINRTDVGLQQAQAAAAARGDNQCTSCCSRRLLT